MVKKLSTEDAVKKAMNIDSFRNLSKSKVIKFVSMLPQMDRDVAISVINQFPNYISTASEMVKQLKDVCDIVLGNNDSSTKTVADAYKSILEDLGEVLKRDDLSVEERERITSQMIDVADKLSAKDTENKYFLLMIEKNAVFAVLSIVSILAFVLGVHYKGTPWPQN